VGRSTPWRRSAVAVLVTWRSSMPMADSRRVGLLTVTVTRIFWAPMMLTDPVFPLLAR
jgi:hypothetical protein